MLNWNRSLKAAAAGAFFLGLWASALAAQDTNTVGPPELKNFQLPRQQTTAPPPAPVPTVEVPPPAIQRPVATPPATTATPAPTAPAATRPVASPAAPARNAPNSRPRLAAPQPRAAPPSAQPAPAAAPPVTSAAPPPPAAPTPRQSAPLPAAPPRPASPFPWLWIAIPAGVVLIGLLAFAGLRRRRSVDDRYSAHRGALAGALFAGDAEAEPEAETGRVPAAEPIPAPLAPVAAGPEPAAAEPVVAGPVAAEPSEAPRPWLDLDIKPDRAAATDTEAVVHYQLQVTNVGDAPARNIRIDARMFNASEADGLDSFLEGAIHRHSGSPHVALPPGESLRLDASTAMKKEDVRAIELAGRSIFVPTVAVNVAYDWGEDGQGRTSRSWVVGRESGVAAAKMGPFRLDLGPRIYRSVGRRDGRRVMV
jgi:hypothetical protein